MRPAASWVICAPPFPRSAASHNSAVIPHMLGWFRWLCEPRPPIGNHTREQRLLCLRRLLDDLAAQGHLLQPGLIIREDFPVRPEYLPRPLSPENDQLLQEELRRTDSLYSKRSPIDAASPGSALENASTCRSIVCGTSGPNSGRCMFPSESFTPNAWYLLTRKDYG